jgi:hypothetical protein
LAWLQKAAQEVEASADKLAAFLRLRYDEMGRLFPHDVFSVQEATPDFFAETARYLTTGIPENRPGIKPEDAKHDIYWRRYRDWMKANETMIGDPITLEHPKKPGRLIFIDGIREPAKRRGRFSLFFQIERVRWDAKRQTNVLLNAKKIHAVAFSQTWFDLTQDGWRIAQL